MFIVYGMHRRQNPISTRVEDCLFCRQPTPHAYIAIKKAAHLFWIPFLPFGAELHRRCHHCGNQWKVTNAPLDTSLFAYLGIVALLFGANVIGLFANLCYVTVFLVLPAIAVSAIYLFTVPGAYAEVARDAVTMPPEPQPGAMHYTAPTTLIGPPAGTIDIDCNRCLRRFQVPFGVPVAICPFCGASQVRRF
jgi:hypothetical protein